MSGLHYVPQGITMTTPLLDALIIVNAVLSAVIVYQLMFFRKHGARHKVWAGWIAWMLIGVEVSFPLRLVMGERVAMDWGHLALNALLCASLIAVEGNIAELFKRTRRMVGDTLHGRPHDEH